MADEAHAIGRELGDTNLEALGLAFRGLALVALGETRRGCAEHDEAAAAVLGADVQPWVGGLVYCGMIFSCRNRADWQRAREWTDRFVDSPPMQVDASARAGRPARPGQAVSAASAQRRTTERTAAGGFAGDAVQAHRGVPRGRSAPPHTRRRGRFSRGTRLMRGKLVYCPHTFEPQGLGQSHFPERLPRG